MKARKLFCSAAICVGLSSLGTAHALADSSKLTDILAQESDLQEVQLAGIERLLLQGASPELGAILGSGRRVQSLIHAIGEFAASASPEVGAELGPQVETLASAFDQQLPGGIGQLSSGLRALGTSMESLAAGQPDSIRPRLAAAGALLSMEAELYDAIAQLDGRAFSAAFVEAREIVRRLDSQGIDTAAANSTRADLESTHLPLVRSLMSALRQTQVGKDFDEVITALVNNDLTQFGGSEGLDAVLSAPTPGGLPGEAPLANLRTALSHLGDLAGTVVGLDARGLAAIEQLLSRPETDSTNFTSLMARVPGLEAINAWDTGFIVEGLLTPVARSTSVGSENVAGQDYSPTAGTDIPINRILDIDGLGDGDGEDDDEDDDDGDGASGLIHELLEAVRDLLGGRDSDLDADRDLDREREERLRELLDRIRR